MKRTFAAVILLAALGVFFKLAWKPWDSPARSLDDPRAAGETSTASNSADTSPAIDQDAALLVRYPQDRALVERVLRDYHHNAIEIERSDGIRGLVLLDRLGLEAVYLYEKYPREFRRLRDSLTDTAAADLLLHWREYFALKRADELDRGILISEISALKPAQRAVASTYPNALPLILTEPVGMTRLIESWEDRPEELRDALVLLDFISLEQGAADLRAALRTLDAYESLALDAFRLQGPDGLAIVKLYGPVLLALGQGMDLADTLILLRVNSDYVDHLLAQKSPEDVAGHLLHVASTGLTQEVGSSPWGLRLAVEFGPLGERALEQAGPDAANVVYDQFPNEPMLRGQAVASLAEHGDMGLAMLAKYAHDKGFQEILQRYGPRVILPIAQADPAPEALAGLSAKDDKSFKEWVSAGILAVASENGQSVIRQIEQDGIERVEELRSGSVAFYEFLPLYDILHLGRVMTRGYTPTRGEMAWAVVDGCFIVADALSLTALQPAAALAAETARSEVKAASREAVQKAGRELTEDAVSLGARKAAREGISESAERMARWWTVRLAGGTYRVMKRLPEALDRLGLAEISRMARPLCDKAGLRLSTWEPMRFLASGVTVLRSIPPERGIKYAAAQALQAGVGVVGIHKMEEHLASRRPQQPEDDFDSQEPSTIKP